MYNVPVQLYALFFKTPRGRGLRLCDMGLLGLLRKLKRSEQVCAADHLCPHIAGPGGVVRRL